MPELTARFNRRKDLLHLGLIIIIAILAYGLLLPQLGTYWDDHGLHYLRENYGSKEMYEYMSWDREWQYYVFEALPDLGRTPLYWHTFIIGLWCLCSFTFYLLLRRLYPDHQKLAVFGSLLFLVFPTFDQIYISIIYRNLYFLIFTVLLSFLFMVMYIQKARNGLILYVISVLLIPVHLLPGEYLFGWEIARILLIYVAIRNAEKNYSIGLNRKDLVSTIRVAIPYMMMTGALLVYRMFFFESKRAMTDQGFFMKKILANPAGEVLKRLKYTVSDFFTVNFYSWTNTADYSVTNLATDPAAKYRIMIILAVLGLVLLVYYRRSRKGSSGQRITEESGGLAPAGLARQLMVAGVIIFVLGQLPIIFATYHVEQNGMSARFGMPGVLGSSLFLTGLTVFMFPRFNRAVGFVAVLTALGAAYQYGVGFRYKELNAVQQRLYNELAWRAPSIEPGTALIFETHDDMYDAAIDWSMSTLVNSMYGVSKDITKQNYFVFRINPHDHWPVYAAGVPLEGGIRNLTFKGSLDKSIVFWQPKEGCLRLADTGNADMIPLPYPTRQATVASRLDLIKPEGKPNTAYLHKLTGRADTNCWCYYFQRADLARQQKDWKKVNAIFLYAKKRGLQAVEGAESEYLVWMEALLNLNDNAGAEKLIPLVQSREARTMARQLVQKVAHNQNRSLLAAESRLMEMLAAKSEELAEKNED